VRRTEMFLDAISEVYAGDEEVDDLPGALRPFA